MKSNGERDKIMYVQFNKVLKISANPNEFATGELAVSLTDILNIANYTYYDQYGLVGEINADHCHFGNMLTKVEDLYEMNLVKPVETFGETEKVVYMPWILKIAEDGTSLNPQLNAA
jgi:hypothetical protein